VRAVKSWQEYALHEVRRAEQKQAELDDARAKLETTTNTEAKTLPAQLARLEKEIRQVKFKLMHLHELFAVVSVGQLRAMGLSVYQNNNPYPGHALIRPTVDMQAARLFTFQSTISGPQPKMFPLGRTTSHALASRTITAATVTSSLVRCP
jgi:hypothetical protein